MKRNPVTSVLTESKLKNIFDKLGIINNIDRILLKNILLKLRKLNRQGFQYNPKDEKTAVLLNIYKQFESYTL